MEVALKRLHNIGGLLKPNHFKRWYCQHPKQSSSATQIYGKYFRNSPRQCDGGAMWPNNQWQPEQFRKFSSNKSQVTDAKKITRIWHTAKDMAAPNGKQINVVSYNILAQDLLVGNLQLYVNCNPLHLKWGYRMPRLIDEIVRHRPDILCLQEVQDSHLNDIAQAVKRRLPMDFVYKRKTGVGKDGCAIFFNKNVFDLIESDAVEYYQPDCERLDRHNIAVIAKLRCKSNPDYVLLVCTTHLLFNPRRQDVRLAQLMVLLAELDRHVIRFEEKSGEMRKLPLILMGDFNFAPDSAPFQLLTTGRVSYDKLTRNTLTEGDGPPVGKTLVPPRLGITDNCQHVDCVESNYKCLKPRIRTMKKLPDNPDCTLVEVTDSNKFSTGTLTHSFNLTSIFDHVENLEDFGSTFHSKWITVDHFFYSDGMGPNAAMELLASYELPSRAPVLPNDEVSSDHLLLSAKFNLIFSKDKV